MKVGLSLGGGGARGLSHIVVLEVLDELGVEVSCISGSSIGALLGMGYADGMSGRDLRKLALETFADRSKTLAKLWTLRPARLQDWFTIKSYSLGQIDPEIILSLFTPIDDLAENIEDLKVPFSVVATDFYGWREVGFKSGNLKLRVAASIAIPFIFKPVSVDGTLMIDGNVSNPVPFDHLDEDCDKVIAVDVVGAPVRPPRDGPSGFEAALGANQIMMRAITQAKLEMERKPDVLIYPPINQFGIFDFLKASTILRVVDLERETIKRQIANALEAV